MTGLQPLHLRGRWLGAAALLASACTAPMPGPEAPPAQPVTVRQPLSIPAEPAATPRADQLVLAPQILGEAFTAELLTAPPADTSLDESPFRSLLVVVQEAGGQKAMPEQHGVSLTSAHEWRAQLLAQSAGEDDPAEPLIAYLDRRDDARPEALPWPEHGGEALVLRTRIRRLEFASGPGVRYLAAYTADVAPLGAGDLFYVFEGLTRDGRYHVGFQFPVVTTLLGDRRVLATSEERAEFAAQADEYAVRMARELAGAAPSSFRPSLERLDAFVRSITVR